MALERNVLRVRGLDAINGTPVGGSQAGVTPFTGSRTLSEDQGCSDKDKTGGCQCLPMGLQQ